MGLDNGICVKRNGYSNSIKALRRFQDSYDKEGKYDFDFCYWRKCWNVREDIFDAIGVTADSKYEFALDIYDIKEIIEVLKSYNEKTWWYGGYGNCSIWTWKEHKRTNRRHIRNLKCLVRIMEKHPDPEVYFYDSY